MNKENHKNTIALDFDGVIHSYISGWTGDYPKDPPNPGTKEALQKLIDEGFELKIYSARSKEAIKKYLKEWGLNIYIEEVCDYKPIALAYIDDKGIRFSNWNKAIVDIRQYVK